MDNPDDGDRTGKWFFEMIDSLGLTGMDDRQFDQETVFDILQRFMHREYDASGQGGLFTLRAPSSEGAAKPRLGAEIAKGDSEAGRSKIDMREIEIWYQMMAYLEENEK